MKTANLNIIISALNKVSNILIRDFVEIENLQNNYNAAVKFTNACYEKVLEKIIYQINSARKDSNIELFSGKKIISNPNAKDFYVICPIDAIVNFSRSIADFSSFISYGIINENNQREIIESAIINPIENKILFTAKNKGVFCDNRVVKINKNAKGQILTAIDDISLSNLDNLGQIRMSGCFSADLAKFLQGKIDKIIIKNKDIAEFLEIFLLEISADIRKEKNYNIYQI